ncbi:MAG: hypothetical protein R6U96_07715 [Promethearchaeia archaeon]
MNKYWNNAIIEKITSQKERDMIKLKMTTPFGRIFVYIKRQSKNSASIRIIFFPENPFSNKQLENSL